VLRSDIVDRLWGQDVFVDVETGVNTAISKIRQALRDSADRPTFIETVPGRGYRFVAAVEVIHGRDRAASLASTPDSSRTPGEQTISVVPVSTGAPGSPMPAAERTAHPGRMNSTASRAVHYTRLFSGLAGVAIIASLTFWARVGAVPSGRVTLAVLPFENVGNDPARESSRRA